MGRQNSILPAWNSTMKPYGITLAALSPPGFWPAVNRFPEPFLSNDAHYVSLFSWQSRKTLPTFLVSCQNVASCGTSSEYLNTLQSVPHFRHIASAPQVRGCRIIPIKI